MQTVIGNVFECSSDFDNKADRDNQGQQPESEAPGKGERILVVDDHPDWLKVARRMLG